MSSRLWAWCRGLNVFVADTRYPGTWAMVDKMLSIVTPSILSMVFDDWLHDDPLMATARRKQLDVLIFAGYGSDVIKTFKISPDAFVQMAIQLAVFKTTGGATAECRC